MLLLINDTEAKMLARKTNCRGLRRRFCPWDRKPW